MKLRVAIPDLISPSYFPAIAAVEMGFFKQEGFDASLELRYPVTKLYEELRDGQSTSSAAPRTRRLRVQGLEGLPAALRARAAHVLVPGRAQGPRREAGRPERA